MEKIEQILDKYEKRMMYYRDMLPRTEYIELIALKGHLIIEEVLYEWLKFHCVSPKYLEKSNLNFYQVVNLVQSFINVNIPTSVFPKYLN